jgi:fibronectin type 3 domain-containing protein
VAPVRTLVWILAGIFLVNLLAVCWLVILELVERHRLNKEIKQVDALWRYLTTPLSATVAWGARGRIGGRSSSRVGPPPLARRAGNAAFGLAVAATVVWVVAAAFGPAPLQTIVSARGVVTPSFQGESNPHPRADASSSPEAGKAATHLSPQTPTGSSPTISGMTSNDEAVPATVAATTASSTAIKIEWAEVEVATSYTVERKTANAQQGWRKIVTLDKTTFTDQGLDAATTYLYRVTALTSDGTAPPPSEVVTATTQIAVPNATDLTVVAAAPDTVVLTWTDVADETEYRVERSLDGTTGWSSIGTPGQNATSFEDTGVSPSTTYFYRVFATNDGGDSPASNVVSATTDAVPPSPDVVPAAQGGVLTESGPLAADGALALAIPAIPATEASELVTSAPSAAEVVVIAEPVQ